MGVRTEGSALPGMDAEKRARESRVLNFSWSFCLFPLNKSSKQATETRQARRQFHFAPKIIIIHRTVLENELFEVSVLIQKTNKKSYPTFMCVLLIQRRLNKKTINTYMKTWHTPFCQFFRITMQTSINSFSKTAKWFLIIFCAKWSWGLACLVSVLCLLLLFSGRKKTSREV